MSGTYGVDGIDFLPAFILLPFDPMLVQVVEQLVDVCCTECVGLPLSRVILQELDVGQTRAFLRGMSSRNRAWEVLAHVSESFTVL